MRARLHVARGDEAAARRDLDAAVAFLEGLGSRIELGRTLVFRAGLSADPTEDISRARELFEACAAAGDLETLERKKVLPAHQDPMSRRWGADRSE